MTDALFTAPSDETAIAVVAGRIGADTVQTVNARDLHAFLGNRDLFANWIADRIRQYDFIEGRDFVVFARSGENLDVATPQNGGAGNAGSVGVFPGIGENPSATRQGHDPKGISSSLANAKKTRGGRPAKEYALTITMAKELAMVEKNERGKRARAYFIKCEELAKTAAVDPMAVITDAKALRGLLLTYSEKVIALEAANAELTPKAAALDRLSTADGSLCITDAAKAIQVQPKALFSYLRQHNWIYKRPGGKSYLGYQARVVSGLLEHKVTTVLRGDGSEKVVEQVLITPRGLTKLALLLQPLREVA